MIKKTLTNKQKTYLICTLNICSILFLLPLWNGVGCNEEFEYETQNYHITGTCKLGLMNMHLFPKYQISDGDTYVQLKAIYMRLNDNISAFTYYMDDSHIKHNLHSMPFINALKYQSYFQFHIVENGELRKITRPNGWNATMKLTPTANKNIFPQNKPL